MKRRTLALLSISLATACAPTDSNLPNNPLGSNWANRISANTMFAKGVWDSAQIEIRNSCIYSGEVLHVDSVAAYYPSSEAEEALRDTLLEGLGRIESISGVDSATDFVLPAAVPNAVATIYRQTRFILYNPNFMKTIGARTGTHWASISVLAHEVGHHLNGHTLARGQSSNFRHGDELEADSFSGAALCRMGAELRDATAVMELIGGPATTTHPAKSRRLVAIKRGWEGACTNPIVPPSHPAEYCLLVPIVKGPNIWLRIMEPTNQCSVTVKVEGWYTSDRSGEEHYYRCAANCVVRPLQQFIVNLDTLGTPTSEQLTGRMVVQYSQ